VLVQAEKPADGAVSEADGIAVLATGLTDAHVHLGRPAKVTAVDGNTLTLEMTTRRGVKTITVTISTNTVFSRIATATNADLMAGSSVVVDMGREAATAESVLIVK
jgi:dihydroorotase-like cyclic amidohydrolase